LLLQKVILKNVGVYREKNEFDFTTTPEQPIILCGGTNGSGKTTLFESIMLCLYGISFFEKKISKKEYENFLEIKIHRYLGTPVSADVASITVQFQFFHGGKVDNYSVERWWKNEDGKIIEELVIQKNGKALDSIEKEQWQSFIEEIIPRGIARLFFFDGEKIVRIAEDGTENIEIKSAFETLLGLDLVEQLRADLSVNLLRNMKGDAKQVQETLDSLAKEKEKADDNIGYFREKQVKINTEIDEIEARIRNLESKISKIGGGYASQRDKLNERKAFLEMKFAAVKPKIMELCAGNLPFCLIPKQLELVKKQLYADEESLKNQFEKEILQKNLDDVNIELKSKEFWSDLEISSSAKDKMASKLYALFEKKMESAGQKNLKGVMNFSTTETAQLRNLIDKTNYEIPTKLENETKEFIKITDELTKIEVALSNAPNDDEIGPIISKLNSEHVLLGTAKAEIDHIEQKISQENGFLVHKNYEIKTIVAEKYKTRTATNQAELSEKIQKVLDNYSTKLKAKKLQMLENYLLEAVKTLMHKQYLIEKVSVNEETFGITLYRKNGIAFPKSILSMGEKQMFATAVLWAISKTSGKPLPFMIDTPLARLDLAHKNRLVEKFFPVASHQVLIFSTDAEIDEENYQKLMPYIKRSFSLRYDSEKGKTTQIPGYFFRKKVNSS